MLFHKKNGIEMGCAMLYCWRSPFLLIYGFSRKIFRLKSYGLPA